MGDELYANLFLIILNILYIPNKGQLAGRRAFSIIARISKTEFSNCQDHYVG